MRLRIFIAIIALNALSASGALALHPEENDTLLARRAAQTVQHTSWSISVWSVMSSTYHMIADRQPTQEEVLREKLKGIVFPDARKAAGELVRDYKLPSANEVLVNMDSAARVTVSLTGDTMRRTDNINTYIKALQAIISFASKGDPCALSNLAWLFTSGDNSTCAIRWPYIDRERASLFREAANESLQGNKTQEQIYEVLKELLRTGRESLYIQPENKKGR